MWVTFGYSHGASGTPPAPTDADAEMVAQALSARLGEATASTDQHGKRWVWKTAGANARLLLSTGPGSSAPLLKLSIDDPLRPTERW